MNKKRVNIGYNNNFRHKRKRKINIKRLLLTTTFLCIIAIMPIALSSFFKIKNIEVVGNSKITSSDIEKSLDHYFDRNLLTIKSDAVKRSITTSLPMEEVIVKHKLPDTLIVKVKEREVATALHYLNGFVLIDSHGVVVKLESSIEKYSIPIVTGLNITEAKIAKQPICNLDKDSFDRLLNLISKVEPFLQDLSEINVEKGKSEDAVFSIYTLDRYKLFLGDFKDSKKLSTAMEILDDLRKNARGKGIIDVSGDTPVFRKFK